MRNVFEEVEVIFGFVDKEEVWNRVCEVCGLMEKNYFFMFVDIMVGRWIEVDVIIGYFVKEVENCGLLVVYFLFLYCSIKVLERN